ncbi:uncharacterized protein LOC135841055 [Planococcus citri]|uniref:uncharacterized protein LOC135841055 n=1 Tax=Planococcus citri TaxID=170843 RepID=UPI0031F90CC3
MSLKSTLLALIGFVCLQTIQCNHGSLPMIPSTPSEISLYRDMFYDKDGHCILTSNYPYYSYFDYYPSSKLTSDYEFNKKLGLYSAIYDTPLSNLYQMYDIIENNMPNLPRDQQLNMLQDLAKSYQDEKIRDAVNPYQYKLNPSAYPNSLTMAQLMGYLPSDLPPSIAYMQNYIDSLLPTLNPDTLAEIQQAVYQNTPPGMLPKADDLTFQLQTAMRYMLANEMYFIPNY